MGIFSRWRRKKRRCDNLDSMATSGVATCDGKHHTWSPWEQYYSNMYNAYWKLPFIERRQKRNCIICHLEQDIPTKED